jgi:hypothetical protein
MGASFSSQIAIAAGAGSSSENRCGALLIVHAEWLSLRDSYHLGSISRANPREPIRPRYWAGTA